MIEQGDLVISFLEKWQSPQNFIMGSDTTELELSIETRSFVNWVNDQVRIRQKRISNVAREGEEHFIIWGMFKAVMMESATFMVNYVDVQRHSCGTKDIERECLENSKVVSIYGRKFGTRQ